MLSDSEKFAEEESRVIEKMVRGNLNKGRAVDIIYRKKHLKLESSSKFFQILLLLMMCGG
jgi:hypothetical protein